MSCKKLQIILAITLNSMLEKKIALRQRVDVKFSALLIKCKLYKVGRFFESVIFHRNDVAFFISFVLFSVDCHFVNVNLLSVTEKCRLMGCDVFFSNQITIYYELLRHHSFF